MEIKKMVKHTIKCVGCGLLCLSLNVMPAKASSKADLNVNKNVSINSNFVYESTIYKAMLSKVEMLVDKLDWDNMSSKDKRKFFKKFKDVTEGLKEVNNTIAEKSNVKIFSDKLVSDVTAFANKNIEDIDYKYLKSTFSGLFTSAFYSISRIAEDNPRVLSMIAGFQNNSSVSLIHELMNS